MPGGFPLKEALSNPNNLCSNLSIPPSSVANVRGSYVTVTASCPSNICALVIQIFNNPQTVGQTLIIMDIGIGVSGSETVIIPNIIVDAAVQFGTTYFSVKLPINIAQGTRIAARSMTNAGSANLFCQLSMTSFDGEFTESEGYGQVDAIGISGTPLLGTQVTPSATFNVKGAYAQLIASTAVNYKGFFLSFDMRGIAGANTLYAVDLAIGAPGSEIVVLPNFSINPEAGGGESMNTEFIGISIPAGTRIAARCAPASSADTHTIGVTFYGVR